MHRRIASLMLLLAAFIGGIAISPGTLSVHGNALPTPPPPSTPQEEEPEKSKAVKTLESGVALLKEGDVEGAVKKFQAARSLAETDRDIDTQILSLAYCGKAFADADRTNESLKYLEQGLALARGAGKKKITAVILSMMAKQYAKLGKSAEAQKLEQEAAELNLPYNAALKPGARPIAIQTVDLTGKRISLNDFSGKVVLIDFWATWCGPCRGEIPNLVKVYEKYKSQGFEVLGISLDEELTKEDLNQFLKAQGMTWRQIYDGKGWEAAVSRAYGVQSIPFTVLVGRDGSILAVGVRGKNLEPAIQKALRETPRNDLPPANAGDKNAWGGQ